MEPPPAGISVVIPTYNRARYVEPLLTSLQTAARHFAGPSEVIIVDDSDAEEAAETREVCERYGARYLPGLPSVREKRNLGNQEARYPLVLFVDSDCQATADLFTEHARCYATADVQVAGVAGVTDFVGEANWMWDVIQRTQFLNAFSFARRMEYAPWATCSNTSYRRAVLQELGGFDVTFPFRLGGDDADLGLRLNKANHRIQCNPNAIVLHTRATWSSFGAIWRRAFRWGRMDLHLYYRKHRDRVALGMPKFGVIFLALALIGLVTAMLAMSLRPLALPLVWASVTLLLQAIGTVRVSGESWRYLPHEMVADVLGLTFEFGTLLEGLRHGEWAVLYKTVQRGPVLPTFTQQEWILQIWSMWIGVGVTLLVQGVWR